MILASLVKRNEMGCCRQQARKLPVTVAVMHQLFASCNNLINHVSKHWRVSVGASPVEEVTLQQYSKSLQRVAVLRLLQQLSHVYSVMKISALADLVPFMSFGEVEQIIVDAVKHDFLQVLHTDASCLVTVHDAVNWCAGECLYCWSVTKNSLAVSGFL